MRLAEPPPDPRQALALSGEAAAERVLRQAGMTIIERRFRRRIGELDLIALDAGIVVFVEVKTRSAGSPGRPADAVNYRKRQRMARVALLFLSSRGWLERCCRFDVVEVFAGPDSALRVRHIEDAFRLWDIP
jgi:putative endonuclease